MLDDILSVEDPTAQEPDQQELLTGKLNAAFDLKTAIKELDVQLKSMKSDFNKLVYDVIPSLCDALGLEGGVTDRFIAEIKPEYVGKFPSKPEPAKYALDILSDMKLDHIVKRKVSIEFTKDQAGLAKVVSDLIESMQGVPKPTMSATLHHATLKRIVREYMDENPTFNPRPLGIFIRRKAVFRVKK